MPALWQVWLACGCSEQSGHVPSAQGQATGQASGGRPLWEDGPAAQEQEPASKADGREAGGPASISRRFRRVMWEEESAPTCQRVNGLLSGPLHEGCTVLLIGSHCLYTTVR